MFTRTRFKLLSRSNLHNKVFVAISVEFYKITYSPPLGALNWYQSRSLHLRD
jgi:hypothetical protein